MRGHIRKHGAGYQFTIDLGRDDETGRRKQKSKGGFKTKRDCEKAMNEMINEIEKGEFFEESEMSVSEYLQKWLTFIQPNVRYNSYKIYRVNMVNHAIPYLGDIKLNKLKPIKIQEFYLHLMSKENGKGLSLGTVHKTHTVLKTALKRAVDLQLIKKNPCDSVEPPKKEYKKIKVLNKEQVDFLLCELKKFHDKKYRINQADYYVPIFLAITTGMRLGEVCGLKWADIDFKSNYIHIKRQLLRINKKLVESELKTKKSERIVYFNEHIKQELLEIKKEYENCKPSAGFKDNDYVAFHEDGSPFHPNSVSSGFTKIRRHLKLPEVSFHGLRHTHATLLLLAGVNAKILSERLGHTTVNMTLNTYSHIVPTMQKQVIDKLDNIF